MVTVCRGQEDVFKALFVVCCLGLTVALGAASAAEDSPTVPTLITPMPKPGEKLQAYLDHQAWLDSPEAEKARQQSETAFTADGRQSVQQVLQAKFDDFLNSNQQAVEPEEVKTYRDDFTAVLKPETSGGRSSLAISTVPLRTLGAKEPVDLGLELQGGELSPAATTSDFSLPPQLGQGVELPEGVGLTVPTSNTQVAPSLVEDDTALYPNIANDSDLIFSSLPNGLEVSTLLRSPQSPESQDLQLQLPAGATLKATSGGGAEVVQSGVRLLGISPPAATDAQGQQVPVTMDVAGSTLRLKFPHRNGDWAYPILVDPAVWDDYQWTSGSTRHDGWTSYYNVSNFSVSNSCVAGWFCWGSQGKWIYAWAGQYYPVWSQAGFSYAVPGAGSRTTFIGHLGMYPVHQYKGDGPTSPYLALSQYDPRPGHGWFGTTYLWDHMGVGVEKWADGHQPQYFNFGQQLNETRVLSGHHTTYVGAITLELVDPEYPTLDQPVSSSGAPQWRQNDSGTVALTGHDAGLGVKYFQVIQPQASGGPLVTNIPTTEAPSCTGANNAPCPVDGHAQLSYNTAPQEGISGYPEGINNVEIGATDAAENREQDPSIKIMKVLIDRTGPNIDEDPVTHQALVTGGLIEPGTPNYQLNVHATDGPLGTATNATARSGVARIEIWVGNQLLDSESAPCNNVDPSGVDVGSCDLWLNGQGDQSWYGERVVKVVAIDRAGNRSERTWQVNFPDRVDPELNLSGRMIDANGTPVPAESVVAVDAQDHGSGITNVSVFLDGSEIQEEQQTCAGGGCSLEREFFVDLSEESPGQHSLEVRAEDAAGRTTTYQETINLDPLPPELTLSGLLAERDGLPLNSTSGQLDIAANDDSSGDSGIARLQVDIGDVTTDTHEPACSPACPGSSTDSFVYTTAEWGTGDHRLFVIARDRAGNTALEELVVNRAPPAPPIACTGQPASTPAQSIVTPAQAATALDSVDPGILAPSFTSDPEPLSEVDPTFEDEPSALEMTGTLAGGVASQDSVAEFTIGRDVCLRSTTVTEASESPLLIDDDSAVYANSDTATDTVIRPTVQGAAVVESLRSSSAPQTFSWEVNMPPGESLDLLPDGSVAVVDPSEQVANTQVVVPPAPPNIHDPEHIADTAAQFETTQYLLGKAQSLTSDLVTAVVALPWVRDSSGRSVPATLAVDGNVITMTINHLTLPPEAPPVDYPLSTVTVTVTGWDSPIVWNSWLTKAADVVEGGAKVVWHAATNPGQTWNALKNWITNLFTKNLEKVINCGWGAWTAIRNNPAAAGSLWRGIVIGATGCVAGVKKKIPPP